MNAGKFRNLITIQQPTSAQQTDGSYGVTWSTFATVYAAIEPLTGKELVMAGGVETMYTHRIRTRAIGGITPNMRVQFVDGFSGVTRYFSIVHIRNVESGNREMQLICEERSFEQ